jgi:hypothetical protein
MTIRSYVIENLDRPGHYWNSKTETFASHLSGDFTTYVSESKAWRVAQGEKVRIYRLRIKKL